MEKDSRSKEDLDPYLVEAFEYTVIEYAKLKRKAVPILTQTNRPIAIQNELYKIGRTVGKKGAIVTNAKGGESPHNFKPSYAFDVGFKVGQVMDWTEENFKIFAKILLKKYGEKITWGGNFKRFTDLPHFELKTWKVLQSIALKNKTKTV